MKCFIFILFVTGVLCGNNCKESQDEYYARLDKLTPEGPCNRKGGICTFAADCPQLTEESGLCPKQQSQGVECCYGRSSRDNRCSSAGGQCRPADIQCGPVNEEPTDCADNEKCCILIRRR